MKHKDPPPWQEQTLDDLSPTQHESLYQELLSQATKRDLLDPTAPDFPDSVAQDIQPQPLELAPIQSAETREWSPQSAVSAEAPLGLSTSSEDALQPPSTLSTEERWIVRMQTRGKKRAFLSAFVMLFLVVSGFGIWRAFLYKSGDVTMADGDHEFSFKSFSGLKAQKKMRTDWSYKYKRRRTKHHAKGKKAGAATFDFTKSGGGSGIPRAKINRIIRSRFRSIIGCLKKRMEVDSRFSGGVIAFSISGSTGKINNISVENTDYSSPVLVRCIRRNSRHWQFPTFPSSAVVHFPVTIKRKTRW